MPILEQHEVAAYLLERRLIARRCIVSGQLRIADASSRNRNFHVSAGPGESYLLKQGIVADSAETLANEVAIYRRLTAAGSPMASYIPRLYGYDDVRGVLIVEWISGGQDLEARGRCPATLSAALGRALAALHSVAPDDEPLRRDAPWVLSLHRPPLDALRYLSAASIELIASVQRDEPFARGLDELGDGWCAEALVHRDVKWANCIACAPRGGARSSAVKLVDWEMAGWGDPGFDVGSVFSDFAAATRPSRPAISAFWRAYVGARDLRGPQAALLLLRAVRYAAARLVQSGFEETQVRPAMSARVADRVRLGRTMLLAPGAAATELLGIAP